MNRMHWYIRDSGKTACGQDMKRRQWTWTQDWKVTCKDCKKTEVFKKELGQKEAMVRTQS